MDHETQPNETVEEAREERDLLTHDPAFREKYLNGDVAARQKMQSLNERIAYDAKPEQAPQSAKAQIQSLIQDKGFGKRLANGDAQAVSEWKTLNEQAARESVGEREQILDENEQAPHPSAYQFNYPGAREGRPLSEEEQVEDGALRESLSDFGFSIPEGNFIAETAFREAPELAAMSDGEIEARAVQVERDLRELWKGDYDRNVEKVGRLLSEAQKSHPQAVEFLDRHDLLNSVPIVVYLAQVARRRYRDA